MSDRQVKQIQRIIDDKGILKLLKMCSEAIRDKVIIENASANSNLSHLDRDFLELYRRWYEINIRRGGLW